VIGNGAQGQFASPPLSAIQTSQFKFEFFERVLELWKDRVQPQQLVDRLRPERKAAENDDQRDLERNVSGLGALKDMMRDPKVIIDPYQLALESPFVGLNVQLNTAALWGRRIYQVAVSEGVLFALAETGEVFAWGGHSHWWHEIQPDSVQQTTWRGDVTARSQLLMGIAGKQLPPDLNVVRLLSSLRCCSSLTSLSFFLSLSLFSLSLSLSLFSLSLPHFLSLALSFSLLPPSLTQEYLGEEDFKQLSVEDRKAECIKVVAKYFNVWRPPPNPALRMVFLEKDILPVILFDDVKFSLQCRGKLRQNEELTKLQMVELLHADIILEKRVLGERAHKAIKEIESQIAGLLQRKRTKLAEKFQRRIDELWAPLREVQAEEEAAALEKKLRQEHEQHKNEVMDYSNWRRRVVHKREEAIPEEEDYTPRGQGLKIPLLGATPRGILVLLEGP
jgi:hypothetical protein